MLAQNAPARAFYAALGFLWAPEAGQRGITVGGTPVEEVRYVLRIADGASWAH